MKKIIIESKKHGSHEVLVDDCWYDELSQCSWYLVKGRYTFYAMRDIYIKGVGKIGSVQMHRQILNLTDRTIVVDHIDGNGLNNQVGNLRISTVTENNRNTRNAFETGKNFSSKYKGVYFRKDTMKWTVGIVVNKRKINLGCFLDETQAAKTYDVAAIKYFGKFAKLNFPELIEQYERELNTI